jgi:uncharacterized protein YbjT (DUF2867 family)
MKTILVTGASGNLGRSAVAALRAEGYTVRAASRNPRPSTDPAVQAVRFDYTDLSTHGSALEGVDGLLLMAPPLDMESPAKVIPLIDRAARMKTEKIVLISALGVDADESATLRIIERHLMASGIRYTILRPNFFMENFTTGFLAPMVGAGHIHLAAGDGKTSFISTADIAAVAAKSFSEDHDRCEYTLTGPDALDHDEAAGIITDVTGRAVTYHAISETDMIQGAVGNGLPESNARFMGILYMAVRNGWMAGVTDDVRRVIGRSPVSFRVFVQDHSDAWK